MSENCINQEKTLWMGKEVIADKFRNILFLLFSTKPPTDTTRSVYFPSDISLVSNLSNLLLGNNLVSVVLAKLHTFTLIVGIVEGSVEEVAHVLNNRACLAKFLKRAGSLTTKVGGKSAGLNELW
jgi:hypothetical protein